MKLANLIMNQSALIIPHFPSKALISLS